MKQLILISFSCLTLFLFIISNSESALCQEGEKDQAAAQSKDVKQSDEETSDESVVRISKIKIKGAKAVSKQALCQQRLL
jgi:hypothetical protein